MEIEITSFFYAVAPRDLCASVAEIGRDAGKHTWQAAQDAAQETTLLDSEDKKDAFRKFASASGFGEVMAEFSDSDLNALFLQWITGDMRQMGINGRVENPEALDWASIEKEQERGNAPSNIFRGVDGEIYFYVGS